MTRWSYDFSPLQAVVVSSLLVVATSVAQVGLAQGGARMSRRGSAMAMRPSLNQPSNAGSMLNQKSVGSQSGATAAPTPLAKPSGEKLAKDAETPDVGDPLAPGKMTLLLQEIVTGIRTRQIDSEFNRWRGYMANRMDISVSHYTGSELTGQCRLKWYNRLMHNPLSAPIEAEAFTRETHQAVLRGAPGFVEVMRVAREKLDLPPRPAAPRIPVSTPDQAIETLKRALVNAQANYAAALSTLTKSELEEFTTYAYSVFVGGNVVGHTLTERTMARRLCDLIEKLDRNALQAAGEELLPLTAPDVLKQLAAIPDDGAAVAPAASGRMLKRIPTSAGVILIGGRAKNVYRLDEMADVAAVVDLGGDDEYYEGSVSVRRPVLALIDLKGDDAYRATRSGAQGGSILGVSLLLDVEGNDVYDARDVAQGSTIAGVGVLIDCAGSDVYQAHRRVQAHALGGVGLLLDGGGNDSYRCVMWGQGIGAPLGFGLLDDAGGEDYYYAGGAYRDSYPETPGLEGWGQGVGAGIRQVANGGVGVLLDGGGDDTYEFDYLSHGGGYWCSLGFLRDFGGNDKHHGSTEKSFGGGQRSEPEYQRFGCGWGCHYAMGFLFDDSGNDSYRGWIMGLGMGWDCALGALCDFGGNDRYDASGGTVEGNGSQASTGILYDYDGDDAYEGYGQGYASSGISYHPLPYCGGNFSFVVDFGGKDAYGCEADNNGITERGWAGGFIVDRPRDDELKQLRAKASENAAQTEQTAATE